MWLSPRLRVNTLARQVETLLTLIHGIGEQSSESGHVFASVFDEVFVASETCLGEA
jgi:hypothetical protein